MAGIQARAPVGDRHLQPAQDHLHRRVHRLQIGEQAGTLEQQAQTHNGPVTGPAPRQQNSQFGRLGIVQVNSDPYT